MSFSCTYTQHKRDYVTADIGSDVNLIDAKPLHRIVSEGGAVDVRELTKTRTFNFAFNTSDTSQPIIVICAKTVVISAELRISHGKMLVLRNVQCMVTDQGCTEALLNRHVPERMGINARDILVRATDRFRG